MIESWGGGGGGGVVEVCGMCVSVCVCTDER